MFVHADGYVSRQYVKVCNDAGYEFENEPSLGDQLAADPKYFEKSTTVILQLGIMLAQTLWRKIAPDELESADNNLISVIFELLKRGRNSRALGLAVFGANLPRWADDSSRRINIVNLAQCHKWLGDNNEMNHVLDTEDWSACSDDFQLCIAVLRENTEDIAHFMKKIGRKGNIGKTAYMTWPIFKKWRKSEEFASAFEEIFGQPPTEAVDSEEGIREPQKKQKKKNQSHSAEGSDDNDTGMPQDDLLH